MAFALCFGNILTERRGSGRWPPIYT